MSFAKTILTGGLCAAVLGAGAAGAAPGKPNFSPAVYADGEAWGTKATTILPAPTPDNQQSFDVLYVVTNANDPGGQLPVSEAAPGNPAYNGGRWFTHTAEWTESAFTDLPGYLPVLRSAEEVALYQSMGYLVVTQGSFPGGPPVYFQCPLLPVK